MSVKKHTDPPGTFTVPGGRAHADPRNPRAVTVWADHTRGFVGFVTHIGSRWVPTVRNAHPADARGALCSPYRLTARRTRKDAIAALLEEVTP